MVDLVTLKGGLVLPADAIALAIQLESDGFTMHVNRETGRLGVVPGSKLSPGVRVQIKKWERHLMALATYRAPEGV